MWLRSLRPQVLFPIHFSHSCNFSRNNRYTNADFHRPVSTERTRCICIANTSAMAFSRIILIYHLPPRNIWFVRLTMCFRWKRMFLLLPFGRGICQMWSVKASSTGRQAACGGNTKQSIAQQPVGSSGLRIASAWPTQWLRNDSVSGISEEPAPWLTDCFVSDTPPQLINRTVFNILYIFLIMII